MSDLDYAIVVYSRKRAHNMPVILELLPSATISVEDSEVEDYAAVVPREKIMPHPPLRNAAAIRNWLMDEIKNEILVFFPDDFVGVQVCVGSMRWITDASEILAIIENAARACKDLGLGTFCFSATPNVVFTRPDFRPVAPVQPVFRVCGVMNSARHRKYRMDVPGRADVDWTLRTLLLDRCVYADVRFFFDCGPVFSGRGGAVGMLTPELFDQASRELKKTWGKAISFKAPGFQKNRSVSAISIRVSRSNKVAQR